MTQGKEPNKPLSDGYDEQELLLQAKRFGMEVFDDLSTFLQPKEFYGKIPYAFVKKHSVVPVESRGELLVVAVDDPLNLDPLEEIRHMLECNVLAVFSPRHQIVSHIEKCYHKGSGAASELIAGMESDVEGSNLEDEIEVYDLLDDQDDESSIVKLLNLILVEAIEQDASDIHFEPVEDGLKVRYRIDGVLQARHAPALQYQSPLLTRIKVMAKMDIAERRRPQDGRIKLRMGSREIDFRVSTVPVAYGERIVLRILDKGNIVLGLDRIGMPESCLLNFRKQIARPEGIILVTGPTGSGKTTTLYSAISEMPEGSINVMTIEDPVEYKLPGIAQISVHPKIGLDFARGLRHILRQDPDVVMVGEIRDTETAEIAIQASLTGHLVLSTLHTNDAPSAVTRLVDMGVEPYLLASTLVGVLAQRLVRKVCPHCKEGYQPNEEEIRSLGIAPETVQGRSFYRGKGCDHCYDTGYKGRHGIYELMEIDHTIQKQIVTSPDAVELRKLALESGMESLRVHGANLVLEGITTLDEVLRVTKACL